LLSGRAPFPGRRADEILQRNKECKIYFQEKYWKSVSKEGIDFVLKLTEKDPARRPSAHEALNHSWFQNVNTDTGSQSPASNPVSPSAVIPIQTPEHSISH
jgi:serine/threonine protein kinase